MTLIAAASGGGDWDTLLKVVGLAASVGALFLSIGVYVDNRLRQLR